MLNRIEQKLTSIVGDDLAARTHLSVIEAPGPPANLNAGRGAVLVSLSEVTPVASFERDGISFNGTQGRRLLRVGLAARIDFFFRPAGSSAAQMTQARDLMLEDMSLVSHGLARTAVVNGKHFEGNDPDPGFRVLSFEFESGNLNRDPDGQLLTGGLRYRINAEIWPPGLVQEEGKIAIIDITAASLPMEIVARPAIVRADEIASVLVRSLPATRVATLDPPGTQALKLAVAVMSDAPPTQRGSITGGTPGAETGFRIIEVTPPETTISYQAPATGISRTRIEYVAIHLATPDSHRGVFLGSTAIRLEPA